MQHIILITGAGKGIGRAIALEFSRQKRIQPAFNPILILCSRTFSDVESVSELCRSEGTKTVPFESDIANMGDIDRLLDHVLATFGTIDCLVNNAGVGRFKNLCDITEDDFDYTMSVNMKGTFFLTQKVFDVMEKKRSGHIIFITSIAAETSFKSSSVYAMSKFGQKGLVETLRLYARECNVRITNVMPGAVLTPMWDEAGDSFRNLMMMPEDIAKPVVDAYLQPSRTAIEEIVLRPVGGDINS